MTAARHCIGNRCWQRDYQRQQGMAATVILFTIALIAVLGAALALAARANPTSVGLYGAKVYASVLLKQAADYRSAYSRYVLDGGSIALMTFHTGAPTSATELFNSATQYGVYQAPPPQSFMAGNVPSDWLYKGEAKVPGVGAGGTGSLIFLPMLTRDACLEINHQLYGVRTTPDSATAGATLAAASGTVLLDATLSGRATGCYHSTIDDNYVFYATLNEA